MHIGGTAPRRVLAAPFQRDHYRAAAQMLLRYPDRFDAARRYLGGSGDYPYRCRIRTPLGVVATALYSRDDMLTVNEGSVGRTIERELISGSPSISARTSGSARSTS